jgi:Domain of unknown function (DUF5102)
VPVTRVEKVDNKPSYGEVPGTEAYNMRAEDARPDQVAVIPDSTHNAPEEIYPDRPLTPGGHPIPTTVLEKIDPSNPGCSELPGTRAHKSRTADALPDLVMKVGRDLDSIPYTRAGDIPGDLPGPVTQLETVDSTLSRGEVPRTEAYKVHRGDALPEVVMEVGDVQGKKSFYILSEHIVTESGTPTSSATRSQVISHTRQRSSTLKKSPIEYSSSAGVNIGDDGQDDEEGEGFGDDFNDFEQGGEDAEFGDFDDGFQEAEATQSLSAQSLPKIIPSFVSSNSPHKYFAYVSNLEVTDKYVPACSQL